MHDAKCRELKVGDVVIIPVKIAELSATEDFCIVSAKSVLGRWPDAALETFGAINTGVMLRANAGDDNDLSTLGGRGAVMSG